MSVGLEPEPQQKRRWPERDSEREPERWPEREPEQGECSSTATVKTAKTLDLVDDAIELQLRRSRVALDKKDDPVAQHRALRYLARARDLARSQVRLGQGHTELHALALLRFVEEASTSPHAAAAVPEIGAIDAKSLVAHCEEALAQLAASGESSNPMLEGRC
eukprot:COSAG02_NODE_25026_length_670_cov_28.866060_1_plen_162_part_10